jgi:hypothetical protein
MRRVHMTVAAFLIVLTGIWAVSTFAASTPLEAAKKADAAAAQGVKAAEADVTVAQASLTAARATKAATAEAVTAAEVKEEPPKEEPPVEPPPASGDAGHVAYMWDFATWADSYVTSGNAAWFQSRGSYARAYTPYDANYPSIMPQIAFVGYHDWYLEHRNLWEKAPREGYENLVATDIGHGFKGAWIDDANFSSGYNKVGSEQAKYNEGELQTIEGIRSRFPSATIELNTQYHDIWPLIKVGNSTVLKVLSLVNSEFKEFGWGPTSGIGSASDYRESLEYVDWLHAHGKSLTAGWDYSSNGIATEEYTLATLMLATKVGDHVDYYHQHPPSTWAHLFDMDLGEPLGARARSSSGVWRRDFAKGVVLTAEPGAATQTIQLGRAMQNSAGQTVTQVTLAARSGVVLTG